MDEIYLEKSTEEFLMNSLDECLVQSMPDVSKDVFGEISGGILPSGTSIRKLF